MSKEDLDKRFAELYCSVKSGLQIVFEELAKIRKQQEAQVLSTRESLIELRAEVKYYEKITHDFPNVERKLKVYQRLFFGFVGTAILCAFIVMAFF